MNKLGNPKLRPEVSDELLDFARYLKFECDDPHLTFLQMARGDIPGDHINMDDLNGLLRRYGWYNPEHFVMVVLSTDIEDLEKANEDYNTKK